MKKESRLILGSFCLIYLILVYFNSVHNYTLDRLNRILRKFLKNDKMFDLEIYIVKLKYTDATPLFIKVTSATKVFFALK